MTNKIKAGKTYSINQNEYTLHWILSDNDRYCSGMARKGDTYVQVKQYKQPLTDDMKLAMRALTQRDLPVPVEARETVRGRLVKYENCVVEPHSGETLAGCLNYDSGKKHMDKAIELCKLLHTVHSKGYALGHLDLSNIEVTTKGLRLSGVEFAQKTNDKTIKEQDINNLCKVMMEIPDLGPSLLQLDSGDEQLKVALSTPNIRADQLGACLVLNLSGSNAYQRVIEMPELASNILQKYEQHKDDPHALTFAIHAIAQRSFKQRFENIRNQRSETPHSDTSTIVPEMDEFQPTPPSTPKLH